MGSSWIDSGETAVEMIAEAYGFSVAGIVR